jgi:tRNA(Ile)-lysidine synthase TilS/MesJ
MWRDDKSLIWVPMRCDRCGREAIHFQRYSGLRLCGEHLAASLEARAKGLIRARGWIRPGDRIAVGLPGDPGPASLLRFLAVHFGMRRDLSLVALTVDEGPGSGMDMARIQGIAEGMGVEWIGTGITETGGDPAEGSRGDPHALHRRLRRRGLAALARSTGATRIALGTSLNDEASAVFASVIRGEAARLAGRPEEVLEGIPLIRPFMRIPGDELSLYAGLTVPDCLPPRERRIPDPVEGEAARMLADYTTRHPSALFAVANLGDRLAGMTGHPSGWPVMERIGISRFATRTGEAGFRRGQSLRGEGLLPGGRNRAPAPVPPNGPGTGGG